MFSMRKSPFSKNSKQNSVNPGLGGGYPSLNPFDSYDENIYKSPRRTSSEPTFKTSKLSTNPFDDSNEGPRKCTSLYSSDLEKRNKYKNGSPESTLKTSKLITNPFDNSNEGPHKSTSLYSNNMEKRNKYKNDFQDRGQENQTVQELEEHALSKAEETTKNVNRCMKIAEDIRGDATNTLVLLHQQGEQITKTHTIAADIEVDLSRGEKLLGSLGSLFSRTWKPTKTRTITGPVMTRDDPVRSKGNHFEQREKLGLTGAPNGRSNTRRNLAEHPEPTNTLQKVEFEKAKQDDTLSDLSNLLGELKDMAVGMGSEIDRQNNALSPFMDDVEELNFRVRGANQRGRRLLGK